MLVQRCGKSMRIKPLNFADTTRRGWWPYWPTSLGNIMPKLMDNPQIMVSVGSNPPWMMIFWVNYPILVFVNDYTIHFATGKWGWLAVLVCCDVPELKESWMDIRNLRFGPSTGEISSFFRPSSWAISIPSQMLVLEYLPTKLCYVWGFYVGKYSSTMGCIWAWRDEG